MVVSNSEQVLRVNVPVVLLPSWCCVLVFGLEHVSERMCVLGEHNVMFFFVHTPEIPSNSFWLIHVNHARDEVPTLLDVLFGPRELEIVHVHDQKKFLCRVIEHTLPNVSQNCFEPLQLAVTFPNPP